MLIFDLEGPKKVNAPLLDDLVSEPWFRVKSGFPIGARNKYGLTLCQIFQTGVMPTYHPEYKGRHNKWANWTSLGYPLEQEQYDFLIALRDKWCIPKDENIEEDY